MDYDFNDFYGDINMPQLKFVRSTSQYSQVLSQEGFSIAIQQNDIEECMVQLHNSDPHLIDAQFFDMKEPDSLEQVYKDIVAPNDIVKRKREVIAKATQKNSNVVKKIGRIINQFQAQYMINGKNSGVDKMKQKLEYSNKSNLKNKIDGFNTSHLEALFDCNDREETKRNLKTSRIIFTKHLRKEIFKSPQLKRPESQLLYLNSLKVCCLRFANKHLAKRLQASQAHN